MASRRLVVQFHSRFTSIALSLLFLIAAGSRLVPGGIGQNCRHGS